MPHGAVKVFWQILSYSVLYATQRVAEMTTGLLRLVSKGIQSSFSSMAFLQYATYAKMFLVNRVLLVSQRRREGGGRPARLLVE